MTGMSELVNEALARENDSLRKQLAEADDTLLQVNRKINEVITRFSAQLDRMEKRLMSLETRPATTPSYYSNTITTADTWGNSPYQGTQVHHAWSDEVIAFQDVPKSGKKHVDARLDGLEKVKKKRRLK